jgi:putative endopeptidase
MPGKTLASAGNNAGVTKGSFAMTRMSFAALGLLLAGSVIGAIAAETAPAPNRPVAAGAAQKKTVFGRWGVDLSGMDRSVNPGDDFFRYMNGAWFDKAVIPPDRTSTGSFLDLDIQSEDQVRAIAADLEAHQNDLTPDEKRVRDLYHSYVDTQRIEQLGLKPAEKDLQTIAAIKTLDDVARAMGSIKLGSAGIFDSRINVDDKNPGA